MDINNKLGTRIYLFFLLLFVIVLVTINFPNVSACTPDYLCNNWGSCEKGIQTRNCQDVRCGTEPIVERRLCAASGGECNPAYQCNDWSVCNYFGKVQDLLSNKLRFNGYQERACIDMNECSDDFVEERKCIDSFDVNFVNVERCGMSYIVALDVNSKKEVSTISTDAWRQQKLNIAFVQSNFSYCPSCYNGYLDGDEEKIDCGGSCKSCLDETGERNKIILVSSSWVISFALLIALVLVSIFDKRTKIRYNIYQAYNAANSGNKEKLAKHLASIRKHYKSMNPKHKAAFTKEIDKLSRRI